MPCRLPNTSSAQETSEQRQSSPEVLAKVFAATLQGLNAVPVTIEVEAHQASMQCRFVIVGLPDNAVRESSERVTAALRAYSYHMSMRSIVVNLAPADLRKEGSGLDLPIALGVLIANGSILPDRSRRIMVLGELGLGGEVLPIKGALPVAIMARKEKYDALLVPAANAREAAVVNDLPVYGVETLQDVIDIYKGNTLLRPVEVNTREEFYASQFSYSNDFADVKGQENVKRALEVAAAGGHNILLIGSPGCGKSMMAKRLPSILPPLTLKESLETTQIHSVAGKLQRNDTLISQRPFRAPHHTVSDVALVGGGSTFMPGEICLAHNGVLFLDELPEFSRNVLETLRQPLEDRLITISRAKYTFTLPCSFMLVASMNPCPCGNLHHPTRKCICTPQQVQRYMSRISGPLLDRIDLQVEVQSVPFNELSTAPRGESSADIRARVIAARKLQEKRFASLPNIHCNAQMTPTLMQQHAPLDEACISRLRHAMKTFNLSARAYDRIVKVARTIADLEGSETIRQQHISEAIGYRNLDRESWIG